MQTVYLILLTYITSGWGQHSSNSSNLIIQKMDNLAVCEAVGVATKNLIDNNTLHNSYPQASLPTLYKCVTVWEDKKK